MAARRNTDNATGNSTPPAGPNQSPGPAARTVVLEHTPRLSTLKATLKLTRAKLAAKEAECQRANKRITELEQAPRPTTDPSQDGERGTHPATEPSSSTCKQRPGPPTAEPHKRTVYGIFQAGGCVDTAEHHFLLLFLGLLILSTKFRWKSS